MSAHARGTDPETSHEAAESIDERSLTLRRRAVLDLLREYGPLSDPQIASLYDVLCGRNAWPLQSPSGLRTRRSELVGYGLVADSGRRVWLDSGRRAIVWEAL